MTPDELEARARAFGLRVIRLVDALPNSVAGRAMGNQLIRSGTSVAANYRAARRARSSREFSSKLGIVVEEADESEFWLGLIVDSDLLVRQRVEPLRREAEELMRIFASSRRTASRRS
jgi:four helix bundle protein